MSDRASSKNDWKNYYDARKGRPDYTPTNLDDFRNFLHKSLLDKIKNYFSGNGLIEIGAGDSTLLLDCKHYLAIDRCVGLDYLPDACDLLKNKIAATGLKIDVRCADMFNPPNDLIENFDFVMSFGVVEHFHNLSEVMVAISKFARPGGVVFTLIPNNKKSIYGRLMRKWNRKVFDAHVLYDIEDLECACRAAGLDILEASYFGSSNFGMLSWCFHDRSRDFSHWIYVQLTRISKAIWFLEKSLGTKFPATKMFAPYIVCVARKPL